MVLSTLGFVSVPTDLVLKDCSQANVGVVPRKMFADIRADMARPARSTQWRAIFNVRTLSGQPSYIDIKIPPPHLPCFGVENTLLTFVQAI
jgi:hypothetical protein